MGGWGKRAYDFLQKHPSVPFIALAYFCTLALLVGHDAQESDSLWAVGATLFMPGFMAVIGVFWVYSGRVRRRTLFVFLVVGGVTAIWSHALLYQGIGLSMPLDEHGNPEALDYADALYFSIVTFSTLGYGDIQPKEHFRLLSALQALYGYLYLGLMVGLLANVVSNRKSGKKDDDGTNGGDG
jgi:hypothetical protein